MKRFEARIAGKLVTGIRRRWWPVVFLPLATACAHGLPDAQRYPLVPLPRSVEPGEGSFRLDDSTRVVMSDPADPGVRNVAELLTDPIRAAAGIPLPLVADPVPGPAPDAIFMGVSKDRKWASPEAYRLEVTERGVALTAGTPEGLFRGTQTLRQLLPASIERGAVAFERPSAGAAGFVGYAGSPGSAGSAGYRASAGSAESARSAAGPASPGAWSIPAVTIEDSPRFRYRGMHLDVGRHLFPVSFIEKYIDLLALYKFNTFHWHLTEDQGWRIEIKKYPRLTEVGAWRAETQVGRDADPYVGDSTRYGGYYTQDEVREVVAYAAARHITIVPEIEMPGHSLAALAAYPELGCGPGPYEVATRWGVFDDVYCPTDKTFTFLENVLTEVMELFPGEYIHIGGDEAPKAVWEASDSAQAVIRREHLADERELQSWFIRRIERFLNAHGRKLIGWDEILEGGLAPEATVMSWRGMKGGIEAARAGHDVIMTPTSHLYFDYYQGDPAVEPLAIGGFTPLEKVYAFEPVPPQLHGKAARHVLGAQGNVWTEFITSPEQVEYMAVPRMLALAEVDWSPASSRSWDYFAARLTPQLRRLDRLDVHYRVPYPGGLPGDSVVSGDSIRITLTRPLPGTEVRYTVDGADPVASSPLYTGPLTLLVPDDGVTVSARTFIPGGRSSAVVRATYKPALATAGAGAGG